MSTSEVTYRPRMSIFSAACLGAAALMIIAAVLSVVTGDLVAATVMVMLAVIWLLVVLDRQATRRTDATAIRRGPLRRTIPWSFVDSVIEPDPADRTVRVLTTLHIRRNTTYPIDYAPDLATIGDRPLRPLP